MHQHAVVIVIVAQLFMTCIPILKLISQVRSFLSAMSSWADQFGSAGPGDASAAPQGRGIKYVKAESTEEKTKTHLALKLGVIANQKIRLS